MTRSRDLMMQMKPMAGAFAVALATVWLSSSALAQQCGSVSWTATSKNERRAIFQARRIGQKDIDQLNRRYGSDIEFQRQRISCRGGKGVTCRVTQRFCITEDEDRQDDSDDFDDVGTVNPNSPQCRKWNRQCDGGKRSACIDYESNCQND
jgi:hypothetical protein